MKMTKTLLGSAAVMALSLGYTSDAKAFDDVDWNWNKDVTSVENITIDVADTFDISGLVEVEKNQVNIGDVTATSSVSGISNNPPGIGEDGVVNIDETITVDTTFNKPTEQGAPGTEPAIPPSGVVDDPDGVLTGSVEQASLTENANSFSHSVDVNLQGEIALEAIEGVNDAVDLPSIESAATAVGNNQTIQSTVALNLHDGQYNMGGMGVGSDGLPFEASVGDVEGALNYLTSTDNTATDILAIATAGAALGLIQQGEVSADSTVSDILNASIDSSATAIGNNLSVDLNANIDGDAFAIADLTQFNYANVTANSSVSGIDVDNYANLGILEMPLVNSVATAVGNNASISVSSPVTDLPL